MSENKAKIAITIDAELLERLDHVAQSRGQSRSSVIERIIREEIGSEEKFLRTMESPVARTVMSTMINTPGILETIAVMVGENMTSDEIQEMREGVKKQSQLGKERATARKRSRTTKSKPKPKIT